jgi:hypothetical protein
LESQAQNQEADYEYDDDGNIFSISMLCSSSADILSLQPTDVENALRALIDSGANITAAPPCVAKALGVAVYRWRTPFTVVFGNGTSAISYYFMELGPVLGRVAIINSCVTTILSVSALNKRGYTITFDADTLVCRVTYMKRIIAEDPIDVTSSLYYSNVRTLMAIPDPTSASSSETSASDTPPAVQL